MPGSLETAKRVLADNEAVLYGIFGVIGSSDVFPPRTLLNEFLAKGGDPFDQDGRMDGWKPFAVSSEEYPKLKAWWVANHPGAVEDALGVADWENWVQEVLDR